LRQDGKEQQTDEERPRAIEGAGWGTPVRPYRSAEHQGKDEVPEKEAELPGVRERLPDSDDRSEGAGSCEISIEEKARQEQQKHLAGIEDKKRFEKMENDPLMKTGCRVRKALLGYDSVRQEISKVEPASKIGGDEENGPA
jgi:hypothetical protein